MAPSTSESPFDGEEIRKIMRANLELSKLALQRMSTCHV